MQTHDHSIPRDTRPYIGKTDETPRFSTSTRYALPTCEASEDGICCWHHADEEYHTKPFRLNGVFYPGETVHLCKQCSDKVWHLTLLSLETRAKLRLMDEGGQVA